MILVSAQVVFFVLIWVFSPGKIHSKPWNFFLLNSPPPSPPPKPPPHLTPPPLSKLMRIGHREV